MSYYGIDDVRSAAFSANVDLAVLNTYRTHDKIGLGELSQDIDSGLQAFDSLQWGQAYAAVTAVMALICSRAMGEEQAAIRYDIGSIDAHDRTEQGQEPAQKLGEADAMVKRYDKVNKIGFTKDSLRLVTADRVLTTIGRAINGHKEQARKALLTHIFTAANAISVGSGKCPSWCGGGSQNYVPANFNGKDFSSSHTSHLGRQADSADGRRAGFAAFKTSLEEHGYRSVAGSPTLVLHGEDTAGDVATDAKYVARGNTDFLRLASTTSIAEVPYWVHGILSDSNAWCVQIGGIPDNFFAAVHSFGEWSPLNPVTWWAPADASWQGLRVSGIDPSPPTGMTPWERLELAFEWGMGVQQPDAGAVLKIAASGDYTDPTLS